MNVVWGMMIDDAARHGDGFELAEPAYTIFVAFDQGEFDHGDGADPIERYTKPMINDALEKSRQS